MTKLNYYNKRGYKQFCILLHIFQWIEPNAELKEINIHINNDISNKAYIFFEVSLNLTKKSPIISATLSGASSCTR